jgi:hypothetical protein
LHGLQDDSQSNRFVRATDEAVRMAATAKFHIAAVRMLPKL